MIELDTALATLLSDATLTADGCTGAFHGIAPEGQAFPYLVFQEMAAPRAYTMGGRKIVQAVYAIKAMDQGDDQARATTLRDRVDALLTGQSLAVSGWTHMRSEMEETFDLPDRVSGETYQQIGGRFRIWLTQ